MNATKKFLAATALAVAGAMTTGCASVGGAGLPDYNSTNAGTRTSNNNSYVGANGIRFYQDGTPIAVNYKACAALNKEVRSGTSGRSIDRAINQGTGSVASTIRKKNGDVKDAVIGGAAGILLGIGGDILSRTINEPRVENLEADCNQEKYYNDWKKQEANDQKSFARQFNTWNRTVTQCVSRQTRTPGADLQQVRQNCEAAAGPPPQRP